MMLTILGLALVSEPAQAKELKVPGLEITVTVPDPEEGQPNPWGWTLGDPTTDIRLAMRKAEAYTDLTFMGVNWQWDSAQPLENPAAMVLDLDDQNLKLSPGAQTIVDHPTLGKTVRQRVDAQDTWMERPLYMELVVFSLGGSAAVVTATSSESYERAVEVLDEALGMVAVKAPPLPAAELRYGQVTADAGYTITLPEGWRALTMEETRKIDSTRIAGEGAFAGRMTNLFIIDATHLSRNVFQCKAEAVGTLEILDPKKSPVALENFKTYARVALRGGRYKIISGTEEAQIDIANLDPVNPKEEGEVQLVNLGTHEAYYWPVKGEQYGEPAEGGIFYTAYGDVGLTCVGSFTAKETGAMSRFEEAVRSVKILDGEKHPQPLSMRAKYIRWWPYSPYNNPWLQLYWVPIPIMLLAVWLITKDE
jgi:hypothetical protein